MRYETWRYETWRTLNLAMGLLAAFLTLAGGAALAKTYTVGSIEIGNPWARATPKGAPVGGAYMIITNKGAEADRLISVASPAASQIEVHQMSMDNGVMSMRPVPGGLEIKPGQTVVLNPESFHLMLMVLKQPSQEIDCWGAPPDSLPLMREIKRRFDPDSILNPGGFLGKI